MPLEARPVYDFRAVVEVVRGTELWWHAIRTDRAKLGAFLAHLCVPDLAELKVSWRSYSRVEVEVILRRDTNLDEFAEKFRRDARAYAEALIRSRVRVEPEKR
jgi:hypothetical protein